jgi:hypothetical protein
MSCQNNPNTTVTVKMIAVSHDSRKELVSRGRKGLSSRATRKEYNFANILILS